MLGNFFKVVLIVKNLPTIARDKREAAFILKSRRSSGRGKWRRNKYSCLKNSLDKKSLVGYNSWPLAGYSSRHLKESDMTEQRNTHTSKKDPGLGNKCLHSHSLSRLFSQYTAELKCEYRQSTCRIQSLNTAQLHSSHTLVK